MTFDVGSVVSDGLDRVVTRAGAIAIGLHTAIYAALVTVLFVGYGLGIVFENRPAVIATIVALVALAVLLAWAALALAYVGTARWLVRDDRSTAPRSALARRAPVAALSVMVLNLGFGVVAVVSSPLLWLPSIAIGTVLIFSPLVVAVEDTGPLAAISRSWTLTEGHRLELFAIGALYNFIFWAMSQVAGIVVILPIVGWVALGAFWAAQTVCSVGILAEAYAQITAESRSA
ncbi:MAG: hypothetical protein ABEJ86_05180 [Halococcoides sp.]